MKPSREVISITDLRRWSGRVERQKRASVVCVWANSRRAYARDRFWQRVSRAAVLLTFAMGLLTFLRAL